MLMGLVLGLAIYNAVLLDFPLPQALYRKLLGQSCTLRDLSDMDPTLGRSLGQLLAYDGALLQHLPLHCCGTASQGALRPHRARGKEGLPFCVQAKSLPSRCFARISPLLSRAWAKWSLSPCAKAARIAWSRRRIAGSTWSCTSTMS